MERTKVHTLIMACWVLLQVILSAYASDVVKISFDRNAVPNADDYSVVLPSLFQTIVAENLPEFRFPKTSDFVERWSEGPYFIAIGDFNKDRIPDVASILIGKTNNEWKLVVFSSTGKGIYRLDTIFDGIGQGPAQGWEVVRSSNGGQPVCFSLSPISACGGSWCWNGKEYQQNDEP